MRSRRKVFELSLTGRDNVHQERARSCKQRSHGHGFPCQFDKWIFPLLDSIPVGHLENDGGSGARGSDNDEQEQFAIEVHLRA